MDPDFDNWKELQVFDSNINKATNLDVVDNLTRKLIRIVKGFKYSSGGDVYYFEIADENVLKMKIQRLFYLCR